MRREATRPVGGSLVWERSAQIPKRDMTATQEQQKWGISDEEMREAYHEELGCDVLDVQPLTETKGDLNGAPLTLVYASVAEENGMVMLTWFMKFEDTDQVHTFTENE
jgi:hypothetical protein